jgi:hypothetical protein
MAMTLDETMARLQALGNEKRRAINAKNGAGEKQYGVPMGEIRKLAAEIKSDHALGLALWGTGNIDAQLLGILLIKPKALSAAELDGMVRAGRFGQVADWLGSYVIKHHPAKEALREAWLEDPDPWAGRVRSQGSGRARRPCAARPDRGRNGERGAARAVDDERVPGGDWDPLSRGAGAGRCDWGGIGVYRDYPVSKGCTSPFAPIWIGEMVRRGG